MLAAKLKAILAARGKTADIANVSVQDDGAVDVHSTIVEEFF